MSKVVAIMSMSLDGYIADLNDGVIDMLGWYFTSGDVEVQTGGSDPLTFQVSGPSAEHIRSLTSGLGAVLTGRRTFEVAEGWGGNHAWGPAFVLTHHVPAGWPRPNSTVHFVTESIESAVSRAKAAAAGKSVGVHGADIIQQCLNAGLLDEISVDIVAVLLGSGVRLFDHLASTPAVLGNPTLIQGDGVIHLRYPVRREYAVTAGTCLLRDVTIEDIPTFFRQQLDKSANYMAAFTSKDPSNGAAFLAHWAKILSDDTITKKTILWNGRVAGHIGSFEQFGDLEVSYWIGKPFWGRGIATRALSDFLHFLKVRPVFARAVKDNSASLRVLEKCGFTISGYNHDFANARNEVVEEVILRLDSD